MSKSGRMNGSPEIHRNDERNQTSSLHHGLQAVAPRYPVELAPLLVNPELEAGLISETQHGENTMGYGEDKRWESLDFRKRKFWVFCILISLSMLPMTTTMPVSYDVTYEVACRNMGIELASCFNDSNVNRAIAKYSGVANLVKAIPTIVMIPFVTSFAESRGYVGGLFWIMLLSSIQVLLVVPVAYWLPAHWTIYRMMLLDLVDAFMGSFFVMNNIVILAISQIFPEPDLRPQYISLMYAITTVPLIVGPVIGAFISERLGKEKFYALISAASIVVAFIFKYIAELPELIVSVDVPLSHDVPTSGEVSTMSLTEFLKEQVVTQLNALKVLKFSHLKNRSKRITAWILIFYQAIYCDLITTNDIMILYSKEFFGWDQKKLGTFLSASSLVVLVWMTFGFTFLQRKLSQYYNIDGTTVDMVDKSILLIGLTFKALGFLLMVLASSSGQYMAALLIKSNSAVSASVTRPATLKMVPKSQDAALMTAIAVLESVATILLPTFLLMVYKSTLSWWPRFEFEYEVLLALLFIIVTVFFVRYDRSSHSGRGSSPAYV